MAPTGGFEPLACRLGGGRSIRLSYVGKTLKSISFTSFFVNKQRGHGTEQSDDISGLDQLADMDFYAVQAGKNTILIVQQERKFRAS